MYVNASCRRSARCLDVLSFLPFGIMRSYPGFCRRKQLEYNPGLTHRRRAGHPRANRRTSDRPSFCGVRPSCSRVIMSCHIFQSTHPMRGATRRSGGDRVLPLISIHAPLAGCDLQARQGLPAFRDFNPRTPCGVRRDMVIGYITSLPISIHAPLAGCDHYAHTGSAWPWNFNPRTPCGVRRAEIKKYVQVEEFQSTHPLRGATSSPPKPLSMQTRFQSTHPLRGATPCSSQPRSCSGFQSTHPLRGATVL